MASRGIDPTDLIRQLFGSKSALLPAVMRQGASNPAINPRLAAATAAIADPNGSGSSNRTKFGLSDFGLVPGQPSMGAPNVAGASKHPGANLRQAAIAAITGQYAPVLGALGNEDAMLRRQAAADRADAQNRGNRAEGDVATLYSRLREYAGNTERAQNQDYRQGVRQTRQGFNRLAGAVRRDLNASGSGIAADLQRLGVDPSVALAGAARDAAFTRSMAREDKANQVANTRSSRREYDAGMGRMKNDIIATGNAAVGTQRSQTNAAIQDIARQLTSNLMQTAMQRAQIQGQEAGALRQLKLSRLQAKQAAKDPMAHLNMLYKQAQIAHLLNSGAGGATGGAAKGPGKGMADALAYLNTVYPGGNANWSTMKDQGLSKMLMDLYTNSSSSKPGSNVAWDKNTGGDLIKLLLQQMGKVKGPKGGTLYGSADQEAARQALMIALGAM